MRLRITHRTTYSYEAPANRAIQTLRLTPRGHDGQFIVHWRIDVDRDCRLDAAIDPFGNSVHSFTLEGPLDGLVITAEGEIETQDTHGIVRGQVERFPPVVFLRDTALTESDAAIRAFAEEIAAETGPDRLSILHGLMTGIKERLHFDVTHTDSGTSAAESFAMGHGVCQDFAHIFIAAARYLEIPARYVGGYLYQHDKLEGQQAGHAWAEALVGDVGWVGFDPANGVCPTDSHLRVAIGLDYLGAAPVRGTRYGGDGETLSVDVMVREAARAFR